MRYTAISPEGRIIILEITDDGIRVSRRDSWDSIEEYIEARDESGLEALGIEMAIEKWWYEGWTITAEETCAELNN